MLDSRSIDDLRPDVAANVRLWIAECVSNSLDVALNSTKRDNEYQAHLYAQGRTRPGNIVTNGKTTTFHGAGLALDFYSESKKWSDRDFFKKCATIAKKYGFSWSGDWEKFVEYTHLQWDNHGRSTYKNAPHMPLYKEGEDMTQQEVQKIVDKALADRDEVISAANAKVASWAQESWDKAKAAGVFDGTRPGAPLTRQEAAMILERIKLI